MARIRFFNASEVYDAAAFGLFTPDDVTSATAKKVVLTGADGQRFVVHGTNMSFDLETGEAAGKIVKVDWFGPDGTLWGVTDQISYSVAKAIDFLFIPPEVGEPHGTEALFLDVMSGDDLFVGPAVGDDDQVFTRYLPGAGDNTIKGSAANERVEVGPGGTIDFDGGAGRDTAFYLFGAFDADRGVKVDLAKGRIDNPFGGVDRVKDVEIVIGTLSDDTMAGSKRGDTLDGGFGGHDRLNGGDGDDSLASADGGADVGRDDTLIGGKGDDTLSPGFGVDLVDGGAGYDVVNYSPDRFAVPVDFLLDLNKPSRNRGEHANDTVKGVEEYRISSGSNQSFKAAFVGDDEDNGFFVTGFTTAKLEGGGGDDRLGGFLADDTLDGGDGDDSLDGGFGADRFIGGAGRDTAVFEAFSSETVDLLDPSKSTQEAAGDTFESIEIYKGMYDFFGSSRDDVAIVGSTAGTYDGRGGDDSLVGGSRDSKLIGGTGNDTLYGGDNAFFSPLFADSLDGGAGKDLLIGGESIDVMTGGAAADRFEFRKLEDMGFFTFDTTESRDSVTDFKSGEDVLRFRAAGFDGLDKDFDLIQGGKPAAAEKGAATFLFDTDNGRLFLDADGKGGDAAIFILTLEDVARLKLVNIEIF